MIALTRCSEMVSEQGFFCMCGKLELEIQVFKFRTRVYNRVFFQFVSTKRSDNERTKTTLVPFESSKIQLSIGTRVVLIRKLSTMFVRVLWKWPKTIISVPIQMASKFTYLYLECHTYRKISKGFRSAHIFICLVSIML